MHARLRSATPFPFRNECRADTLSTSGVHQELESRVIALANTHTKLTNELTVGKRAR